jgi:hypothetical protein
MYNTSLPSRSHDCQLTFFQALKDTVREAEDSSSE